MACRGAQWLGWAALLLGAVVGGLRAQADGTLRWAFAAGSTGTAYVVSSPAVGPDGTVFFGVLEDVKPNQGRVFALRRDGSRKWDFKAPDFVESSPALSTDGTLYFTCWDGKLYALNAETGVKKWEYSAGTYLISSPTIGPNGAIYFGGGDSALHAVSPAGVRLWSFSTGYPIIESSPAVGPDGSIYFGSIDRNVYALTPEGALKWRFATGGSVTSSPAVGADGTIYIGSYDHTIYALDPNSGLPRWAFGTKGQVSASPVLGPDGTVYCGSEDSFFYAINSVDGSAKWSVSVGRPIVSSAAVRSDGTVIFGADDSVVRALYTADAQAGITKWAYKTGDIIEAAPIVARDGTVYVGSLDGKLYSFNGSGAALSDYSRWPAFRRDAVRSGALPRPAEGGRLVNLATRALAGESTTLIAGLVSMGTAPKSYLIRAVGPSLAPLGVANPLGDPALALRALASETVLFSNDDWGTASNVAQIRTASTAVGAFPLIDGSRDSVVLGALGPGAYTAAVTSGGGPDGVALVEAYDTAVNSSAARLINLSTRAQVGTGDRVLIPGLVIGGIDPVRVLVRAIGPGLAKFGVTGVLARPTMTVFAESTQILTNAGWSTSLSKGDVAGASAIVGAFPLAEGSADCAALLTLNAGNYTIQVSGVGGTTGEALVEVYVLP